jgi:glucose-1-phosphatase
MGTGRLSVRAVILDLGNVLVFHDNAALFRRLGERAGISGPEAEALIFGNPLWERANLGQASAEEIHEAACRLLRVQMPMREFAELWCSHFTPNPPMFPLVEALEPKVALALLSNTNALHLRYLKAHFPVLQRFKCPLYSCEVGMAKPDPAFYREALARLSIPAPEAVFFDDVPEYVEVARTLGMQGRVFTTAAEFVRQLSELGL